MRTAGVAFALSLTAALALTPLVRGLARRLQLFDSPGTRKLHTAPVPRIGGVALVLAFFAPLVGLLLIETDLGGAFLEDTQRVAGLFAGGLAIATLGVYDDLHGATAREKLAVQLVVALLMYGLGFRIEVLANPFGADLSLGWLGLPLTLFWIVGVINALNLIDGLDGLAAGVSLFAIGVMLVTAWFQEQPLMFLFGAALAGAVLGFLLYNRNPASIFMGDSGSMFLGFVLATTALQTNQKSSTAVALLTPIVALGLPILDTLLAIARRAARGRPLFGADREHVHHRLLGLGLSQRQAALVLYGFCVFLGLVALALTFANGMETGLLLAVLAVATVTLGRKLGYFQVSLLWSLAPLRRRNRLRFERVRELGAAMHGAADRSSVIALLPQLAAIVGAESVRLVLPAPKGARGPADPLVVRFPVPTAVEEVAVEVTWTDDRAEVGRDDELVIELFCRALGPSLDRLAAERVAGEVAG